MTRVETRKLLSYNQCLKLIGPVYNAMPLEVTFHIPWELEAFHARFPGRRNDPRNEAPHRTREKTSSTQGTFHDDHSVKGTMTRFCACAHLDF